MVQREEVVKKLSDLRQEEKLLREKIAEFDYEERLASARVYEGKYFRAIPFNDDHIECVFVYNVDVKICEPQTVRISYWPVNEAHFEVSYTDLFYPKKWNEEDKWQEITKEEFNTHYTNVLGRIEAAVRQKS